MSRSTWRWLIVPAALLGAGLAAWLLLSGPAPAPSAGAPLVRAEPAATSAALEAEPATPEAPARPDPEAPRAVRAPARVRGTVEDATGRGVPGARLRLAAVDLGALRGVPAPDGALLAEQAAERDGGFDLAAPTGPLARLTAEAPGFARAAVLVDDAGAQLTLTLLPEARLRVRAVTSEDGAVGAGSVEVRAGRVLVSVPLEGGEALLDGLPAGAADVRVRAAEGLGEARDVRLEAGATAEVLVALAPAVRVAGVVLEAESEAPLADAEVRVARPGRSDAPVRSDAAGRFGPLEGGLQGESVWLSVEAPGRPSHLELLVLPDAATEPLELRVLLPAGSALSGRVEAPDGAPVAGARVSYSADGVAGHVPAAAASDAEGRFTLPPPPAPAPGRRIVVLAEGDAGRAALALRPGAPPPEPLVLRLSGGARVVGRVADGDQAPRAGVLVRVQPAWDALPERAGADLLHAVNATRAGGLTALTGPDGRFAVEGVPAGRFRVALDQQGSGRSAGEPFDVGPGTVDLGTLTLGGGLTLAGRVLDAAGRPVAAARVRELRSAQDPRGAVALSGPNGRFVLTDLVPGSTTVEAEAPGLGRVGGDVTLPAAGPLDLRLPAAAALELSVEDRGAPYTGLLSVRLRGPGARAARAPARSVRAVDGRVRIDDLPAGTWSLEAAAPGARLGRSERALVLEPGLLARAQVALRPAARVTGRVLTPEGRPAPGARVEAESSEEGGARGAAACDPEGAFALTLPPGAYVLRAQGRGGAPSLRRVDLGPGAAEPLDLRLAPAGTLEVLVRRPGGAAAQGALVILRHDEGPSGASPRGPARTDASGRVVLADLPLGGVLVRARAADGQAGAARASVRAGEPVVVELELSPAPR